MNSRPISGSGRVESGSKFSQVRPSETTEFANDSLRQSDGIPNGASPKGRYVTRGRVAALQASLGPRERAILETVALLGIVSGEQLLRLHYEQSEAGKRLARIDLARLCEHQVLTRLGRSIGGQKSGSRGYLLTLGPAGQRIVWPNRRRYRQPWTPGAAFVGHALATSELYVGLRREAGDSLLAFDTEPRCWRRYFGPGGAPATLKPDAYVELEVGDFEDRYFVETDCATESGTRIIDKATAYIRYRQSGREQADSGVFPWVLWVTTTEARRQLLADSLARLPAEHWQLFRVTTAAEAVARLIAGVPQELTHERG